MTADGTERAVIAVIAAGGADAFEILRGRVVPLDLLAALWAVFQIRIGNFRAAFADIFAVCRGRGFGGSFDLLTALWAVF